jgi:hypothetical protein
MLRSRLQERREKNMRPVDAQVKPETTIYGGYLDATTPYIEKRPVSIGFFYLPYFFIALTQRAMAVWMKPFGEHNLKTRESALP